MKWFSLKNSQYFINYKKQNFTAAADECKTHRSNVAVVDVENIKSVYEKVRDSAKSARLEYLRMLTNESSENCYAILNLFVTKPDDIHLENVCSQHQSFYQELPTLCEKSVPRSQQSTKTTFKNNNNSRDSQELVAVVVTFVLFIFVSTVLFTLLLLKNSSLKYQDEIYDKEIKISKKISKRIQLNEEYKNVSELKIIK